MQQMSIPINFIAHPKGLKHINKCLIKRCFRYDVARVVFKHPLVFLNGHSMPS